MLSEVADLGVITTNIQDKFFIQLKIGRISTMNTYILFEKLKSFFTLKNSEKFRKIRSKSLKFPLILKLMQSRSKQLKILPNLENFFA